MRFLISKKYRNFFSEIYEKEYNEGRFALLIPIIFACGIASYFAIKYEPKIDSIFLALALSALLLGLSHYKKRRIFLFISVGFVIFSLGFLLAKIEADYKNHPKIQENLGVIWLRAKIQKIETEDKFIRLILRENNLWQPESGKFSENKTPKLIRLNVRTKLTHNGEVLDFKKLNQNDYIQVRVILSPPAKLPAFPNAYDFAKYSYFEEIGAVGFAISEVKILQKNEADFIQKLRIKINYRIDNSFNDKQISAIAKALVTGDRAALDNKTNEALRYSGLGHILSISGLHLSIVMVWVYGLIRLVIALFPAFALRFDSKKISAIFAILFGLIYLYIANKPIPAVRSYLMLTLFFLGILLNREISPFRPLAVAGFLILIIEPSSLVNVSFQLSFGSIIALAGVYEIYAKFSKKSDLSEQENFFKKSLKYLFGIMASSLIVGVVTGPIIAYHFSNISKFSAASNLITLPFVSFVTMPALAIASVFSGFEFSEFLFKPAEFGIRMMLFCAEKFGDAKTSTIRVSALPEYFLILVCVGWVWFFVFTSKIRYFALPFIFAIYLVMIFAQKQPDILIDEKGKTFIIKAYDKYYIYGRTGGFKLKQYKEKLGVAEFFRLKKNEDFLCKENFCSLKNILIIRGLHKENQALCESHKVIINLTNQKICDNKKVISLKNLSKNGTHLIWQNGRIENSRASSGLRIWNE
ncbi:MAG: ComEC/Rec2 family competence protein [Rickettsiales bacterium]|nr:ComEC/Rec2 family competence protein [Rickettsiales bacterium]